MRRLACALLLGTALGCGAPVGEHAPRMLVLGIDGLDPGLLQRFMDAGELPHFRTLAESGDFVPLGTTVPPQSPVAWSTFITGLDPGGHGIFDFIALDRETLLPYLSTTRTEPAAREPLEVGRWCIPLGSERTVLLRDGRPFWEPLGERGVHTTLFRMPANYPPGPIRGEAVSGMGTPDLRGTPGIFTFLTEDPSVESGRVSGGEIVRVRLEGGVARARVEGPPNGLLCERPATALDLEIYVDPEHPVAELRVGDARALLNEGEWSDWLPFELELGPAGLLRVPGMLRAYLKQVRPHLALYVSPLNIDPAAPAQPIAMPPSFSTTLAREGGRFYTQEMPEDTKALQAGVLSPREFVAQSELVWQERARLLESELARFRARRGASLLFFYLSSVDQRSHVLYRQLTDAVRHVYQQADALLGRVRETLDPETTLVVMSDHGFQPFRRQAHLNRWLEEHGYLALRDPEARSDAEWLEGLDWRRTRAFAIGLNSLYLNVRGRERFGVVDPTERIALAREIAAGLASWRDPEHGDAPVVTQALLREDAYHGPHVSEAPDILVGYGPGYRASWATTSGKIPALLLEDNDRPWSGDHCMDARLVPGVLLSNRPLRLRDPDLRDLTVSILTHFGVPEPEGLPGRSVF